MHFLGPPRPKYAFFVFSDRRAKYAFFPRENAYLRVLGFGNASLKMHIQGNGTFENAYSGSLEMHILGSGAFGNAYSWKLGVGNAYSWKVWCVG